MLGGKQARFTPVDSIAVEMLVTVFRDLAQRAQRRRAGK